MAKYRGVRPKGNGIEIAWQVRGKRHYAYIDKAPTDANQADAARARKRLIEAAKLGEASTRASVDFEHCCRGFLQDKSLSLKPSTLYGYKSKLEFYWSGLASMPIRAIKLTDLKAIDRAIEWKSQKTRRDAHAVLRGVIDWAIGEDLADENPAQRLTAGAWQRPEIDAFTDAERIAILDQLQGTARVFYGVMFETGARTGELMALQWQDVDPGYSQVRIAGSTYRGEVGSTKTHQARTVLLTAAAGALLKNHTESRFRRDFVFLNQYGKPYAIDRGLTFAFKLACERAGVRYRRPYNCRHTFASRAITAGAEPSWVARQMGDRLETVIRHYAQWINNDRDRLELEKLESANKNVDSVWNADKGSR